MLLASTPGIVDWRRGWMWVKLAFVVALTLFHFLLGCWSEAFAEDRNRHPTRFFRLVNELPTVALIIIVALVVVKPF